MATHEPLRTATIKEVAALAGVGLSSVSRVLNDHPDVSQQMRDKVQHAVATLGYEPDLLAASLRRGQTNTVGFIVPDIVNSLFASILTGAERRLRAAGYAVLIAHSEGDPRRDAESAQLFRRRRVDGLLVSITDEEREESLEELQLVDYPVVLLDRHIEALPGLSAVLADHRTGLRRATEHLIDLGHRDIRLITGQPTTRPSRERVAGIREAYERRGLDLPPDAVIVGDLTSESGSRTIETLIRRDDLPGAIIAGGNLLFTGIIGALHRHGVRIGRDISLITCDDIPLAEFHDPPISVVARDTEEMGVLAAGLLLEQLDGGASRIETVPTSVILRESTSVAR